MKLNKQSLSLITILTVIVLIIEALTISILYHAAFEQQRAQLVITTQSQARLIESVARFDEKFSANDVEGGAAEATSGQVRDAHLNIHGFGQSGEFLFGKKENNKIVFLLPRRFKSVEEEKGQNRLLDVGGSYAEPIQLALAGKSGTIIANDYRGEKVLAAYEPVKILNYGVVTKIDINEIRAPFIHVGIISVLVSIVLITVGAYMFLRITEPMVKRIEGSAARLNEAQRLAKVGSWELDLMSGELIWSDEIFNIFEIDKSKFDATYEAFLNTIHPEDREKVNQAYSNSLLDRKPYEITYRLQMSDGTVKHVRETCKSIFNQDNKPIRSVGTVQDLTEQAEYENALRESEEKFRSTFEQAAVGVAQVSPDGGWLKVNHKLCDIIGYTEKELLDKTFLDITHPDDLESDLIYVKKILTGEIDTYSMEKRYLKKEGEIIWVYLTVSLVKNVDGTPKYFISIVEDINDRKITEAELTKYRNNLEELVRERTIELKQSLMLLTEENIERKKAEERLEKASAAKSDFLSRMSHELRTPMNAILGFGQLLEMDKAELNNHHQENVKEILNAGHHLLNLINEMLDLTEIEAGKLAVSMDEVEVEYVLKQCMSLINPLAEDRQLKKIDNISGKGYLVQADFTRLKQVLLNLLSNAVKYNRDKGSITLNGEIVDARYLRISITDTGEGLAKEDIGKLFTSFERLNTKFNIEGTGIGLVITKNLTELMDGRIGVDSTLGEGSTFWVELKMA